MRLGLTIEPSEQEQAVLSRWSGGGILPSRLALRARIIPRAADGTQNTEKAIRHAAFRGVPELILSIEAYVAHHYQEPKSLVWTAKPQDIVAHVGGAREALDETTSA